MYIHSIRNYLKLIEVTNTFPQYYTVQYIQVHEKHFDFIMSSYSGMFCVFIGFIWVSLNKNMVSSQQRWGLESL